MAEYRVGINYTTPEYEVFTVEADDDDEATDLAIDQLPWDYENADIEFVEEV